MELRPTYQPDANLDLSFSRVVDVPRALVWRAWTEPALLKHWFCPLPWKTIDCEIDLRPGGMFRTTMQSPEGQEFPGTGCYLAVVPQRRLVWTNALLPGFRPARGAQVPGQQDQGFVFTAMVEFADAGPGTRYSATVVHADEDGRKRHEAMGFESAWGAALDQLVALVKTGI